MTKNVREKIKVELKARFGQNNVELVTNMPQEDLYFIMDNYNNGTLHRLEKLGNGTYGSVHGYKNYAIKKFFDSNDNSNRDIGVLKDLKHLECIPTLYAVIDNAVMITERIHGKTVRDYCKEGRDNNNEYGIDDNFINEWEKALADVVKAGYSPDDLHESNVMIDAVTKKPKLVDVGWFFRHENDYDNFDIHSIKSDYGYSRAESWTGDALRTYVKRQKKHEQEKAKLEQERMKQAMVADIHINQAGLVWNAPF